MRNFSVILVATATCGCYTAPHEKGTQPAADVGVEVQQDAADATDVGPSGDVASEVQATCAQMGVECGLAPNGSWCGWCAAGKLCSTAGMCVPVEVKPAVDAAVSQDTAPAPQPDVQQQLTPAPTVTSCNGRCGTYDASAACQCDAECHNSKDCCSDKVSLCGSCEAGKLCTVVGAKLFCANFSGLLNAEKKCASGGGIWTTCDGSWKVVGPTQVSGWGSPMSFTCELKPVQQPPQPDPTTPPPTLCKVWRKDVGGSAGWLKLFGGPIATTDVTKGPWTSYALDTAGVATVPIAATDVGLSILPQINASLWGYGHENGGVVIKGSWAVKCPGFQIEISGSPKPCAGGQLPGGIGNWCTHSWGASDHRIGVRVK